MGSLYGYRFGVQIGCFGTQTQNLLGSGLRIPIWIAIQAREINPFVTSDLVSISFAS